MTATTTTATLAAELGTDARTLRKFLRSDSSPVAPVGKGKRYALPATKSEINKMRKAFLAWGEAAVAAKQAKLDAADAVIEDDADEPEMELTDDELEEMIAADFEDIDA